MDTDTVGLMLPRKRKWDGSSGHRSSNTWNGYGTNRLKMECKRGAYFPPIIPSGCGHKEVKRSIRR